MIIYCDGVFDLFHHGHLNHFKSIKDNFPGSFLIVAIMDDESTSEYKRTPIYNYKIRYDFCNSCKYVDKAIKYEEVDENFIIKNNIDIIVHAFYNNADFEKQKSYFEIPIRLNKMKVLQYSHGVSTTKFIKKMDSIKPINKDYKDLSIFLNSYPENTKVLIICDKFFYLPKKNLDFFTATFNDDVYFHNVKYNLFKSYLLTKIELPFKNNYFDYCIIDKNLFNVFTDEGKRVSNHVIFN
jgi:cytidyltransferase-like protein